MTKPTREELEIFLVDVDWQFIPYKGLIVDLVQAYLAQEEELERDAVNRRNRDRLVQRLAELKAENQALKASMEAEYIERQAKHIQELVKENEALKAFIGNMHVSIATPFFDSKLNREGQP